MTPQGIFRLPTPPWPEPTTPVCDSCSQHPDPIPLHSHMKGRTNTPQPRPFSFGSRQNRRHRPRSRRQVVTDPTKIPHESFVLILHNQHEINITLLMSIPTCLRAVHQQTTDRVRITLPHGSHVLLKPEPFFGMPILNATGQRRIRVHDRHSVHLSRSSTHHPHATTRRTLQATRRGRCSIQPRKGRKRLPTRGPWKTPPLRQPGATSAEPGSCPCCGRAATPLAGV